PHGYATIVLARVVLHMRPFSLVQAGNVSRRCPSSTCGLPRAAASSTTLADQSASRPRPAVDEQMTLDVERDRRAAVDGDARDEQDVRPSRSVAKPRSGAGRGSGTLRRGWRVSARA